MSVLEAPDKEPNTVMIVHQHGYLLHDRLIRPAMVLVSGANKKAEKEEQKEQPSINETT